MKRCEAWKLATYPRPVQYLANPYGEGFRVDAQAAWHTKCEDCRTGFTAQSAEEAQQMWWEHVRDGHPTAWALLRADAPDSVK